MVENNSQAGGDYITPGNIKTAVASFLRFFFKIFDFLLASVRQYAILFLVFCIIGLAAGYAYSVIRIPSFKSELIVQQGSLTRKGNNEVIGNLNAMLVTKSYSELSSLLKMKVEDVKEVLWVGCSDLDDESLEKDTSAKTNLPFKIKVKVRANNVLPGLQTALVGYLNSNDYARAKREGQRKIFQEKLAFIENELKKIDSLEIIYDQTIATAKMPATFYNNALNPSELYVHSANLAGQKEYIYNWMNLEGNGILVIDGFKVHEHPQSAPTWFLLSGGLLAGILLGLLFAVLLKFKREM